MKKTFYLATFILSAVLLTSCGYMDSSCCGYATYTYSSSCCQPSCTYNYC